VKLTRPLAGFAVLTALYLGALVWVDAQRQIFSGVGALWSVLPVLVTISGASYVVRFARWHWLLARAGHQSPWLHGFAGYLAGFAFTATPGKIGELVRIRYFAPLGVPAWRIVAAFVYERAVDLLVVLLLACLSLARLDLLLLAAAFVAAVLAVLVLVARRPALLTQLAVQCRARGARRLARGVLIVRNGLAGCGVWANPLDASVSVLLGFAAWGLTSLSFVYLLGRIGVDLPPLTALALYPIAMLAGAASMLPGGIGSTEAAIVALLAFHGAAPVAGTLAAVSIRIATLWFAIVCGFGAIAFLESRAAKAHTNLR
jgi:uncharacterized membrane protein YbhN (UPF0104 family)